MDLEKQKRNQVIRVVLTEILMVLAIIPIVILLTLMAMGYRLGEDLSLEQSGLVQVNSLPNGANVKVDGEEKFRTDASRMLTGGKHTLELTREGFDSWSKEIEVVPGFLLRVRYPRLFRTERKMEGVVALDGLRWLEAAPSRTRLIGQVNNSAEWQLIDIRNDEVKMRTLELSNILTVNEAGELLGTVGKVRWSWNSDAALVEMRYAESIEWVLIDMRENVPNRNLTKDFGMAISDVQFAGDSTERLYILENGNLREINLGNNGITKVLLSRVEDFYAAGTDVGYIGKMGERRIVGVYHNGDERGIEIAEAEEGARVTASEYYGVKYVSYAAGQKLMIYEGESFPSADTDKKMRLIVDTEAKEELGSGITVNRTGEVILARGENSIVAVDLETNKATEYEAKKARFIDDYLLYEISEELTVFDFDGGNRRVLAQGAADIMAVISANNKWLYYITEVEGETTLVREKIN